MRSIPTITRYLLLANVILFVIDWLMMRSGGNSLCDTFALHYVESPFFHIFQPFTYMFMHGSWTHLFFNMFALWMFGGVVEKAWGGRRYLIYYIMCGLGAALVQEISQYVSFHFVGGMVGPTVGASGCIYGVLLAFGMTWPEQRIFIFPLPIPIKAKWFVCGYAALEIFMALSTYNDGVAHVAHLGGMLIGFILFKHWQHGGQFGMTFNFSMIFKKKPKLKPHRTAENVDWKYNEDKKSREETIDKILDKVRRNGYESLTSEEKRILFEK